MSQDQIFQLCERVKTIACELEKDQKYSNTARELLMIAVSLEVGLLGVIQEVIEDDEDDDDFVDYGEITA